jgi:hypothetical protein
MKFEIKTVTILMYAALALALGSCTKKTITPAEDPQPAEVGFTASSQAVWVKGGETPTTSFPYDNFGVWGIARQNNLIYNLWGNGALINVVKNTAGSYIPNEPAYWLNGYTYNFIALAPHLDAGLRSIRVTTKEDQTASESPSDYMTFTYDMSDKYTGIPASGTSSAVAPDYTFDLLGAAAEQSVNTGGYSTAQNLMFWHLLSQININVSFGADLAGTQIVGEVTGYRLENVVSSGVFELKHKSGNEILATCTPSTAEASKTTFSFTETTVHIIPQNVQPINLYLDFVLNKGQSDQATYSDFKISLNVPANANAYLPNGRYNWNITIGAKNAITFDIDVTPWQIATEEDGFDPEIEM